MPQQEYFPLASADTIEQRLSTLDDSAKAFGTRLIEFVEKIDESGLSVESLVRIVRNLCATYERETGVSVANHWIEYVKALIPEDKEIADGFTAELDRILP